MSPRVLILIVNYNGSEYLGDCFSSLANIEYPADRFNVLVVDNASTDGSADQIAVQWPEVQLYRSPVNLGFAGGNNIGMRIALGHGYDYVYLLNQDTAVAPGFLDEAIACAERDSAIGAVQSKVLLHHDKGTINSIGNEIHFLGFAFAGGNQTPDWNVPEREITYPSGAAVLLRCAALRDVGLFDEELFMYHEDVDLGWRLWLRNWRCVLAPKSVVYHKYEFSRSVQKFYFMERNRYLVLLKNAKVATLLLIGPALGAMKVGMLVYSILGGWWREEFRALGYFFNLKHWALLLRKRREVQTTRKVSDRIVWKRFVGRIGFQELENPLLRSVVNPIFGAYWSVVKRLIFF